MSVEPNPMGWPITVEYVKCKLCEAAMRSEYANRHLHVAHWQELAMPEPIATDEGEGDYGR